MTHHISVVVLKVNDQPCTLEAFNDLVQKDHHVTGKILGWVNYDSITHCIINGVHRHVIWENGNDLTHGIIRPEDDLWEVANSVEQFFIAT